MIIKQNLTGTVLTKEPSPCHLENITKILTQVADGADKEQIVKAIRKVFFK